MNKAKVEMIQMEVKAMGYDAEIIEVTKTNDTKQVGLVIKGDSNISPTVYLDQFEKIDDIKEIASKVVNAYEANKITTDFDVSQYTDFERVKPNLYAKVINTDANADYINGKPSKKVFDLSILFYCKVAAMDGATITVTNQHMEMWNTTVDELYEIAMANVAKEVEMFGLMEMLTGMASDDDKMIVITNKAKTLGAIAMFNEELCESIKTKLGNFFILPSSIHECICVPEDDDADGFIKMVNDINGSEVAPDEVLSNRIYRYDGKLSIV